MNHSFRGVLVQGGHEVRNEHQGWGFHSVLHAQYLVRQFERLHVIPPFAKDYGSTQVIWFLQLCASYGHRWISGVCSNLPTYGNWPDEDSIAGRVRFVQFQEWQCVRNAGGQCTAVKYANGRTVAPTSATVPEIAVYYQAAISRVTLKSVRRIYDRYRDMRGSLNEGS